jgi:hypothetical protein
MSRLPHLLYNLLTDGGEVISLMRRSLFAPPGKFSGTHSARGLVDPRAIVRLEG